ncbi:hypothetical protein LIA77_02971 [Sarocladium implicatum]|nr:hypothetical protein LIA77_02971 [Sarocladium implicatum]
MAAQLQPQDGQIHRRPVWLCLVTILLAANPVLANMRTAKFRTWFPTDGEQWEEIARGPCAADIARFHAGDRSQSPAPCAAALNCVLENTTESGKSNLGNAQVVLGLTPTIISLLGSQVAELAVLGLKRPWLTLLLGLGAPALQMQSPFTVLEATDILRGRGEIEGEPRSSIVSAYRDWLKRARRGGFGMKVAVKLCYIAPYVLALGAIANNVTTSLYLDLRAVVAFRCGAIYMPLVWGLLGVFPALFAMVAAWRQYGFFKPSMWPFSRCKSEANDAITSQSWAAWAHQAMSVHRRRRSQWLSDLVFSAAAIASILQLIFGTSLLSAMTPVFYWDALPIITRYAISTLNYEKDADLKQVLDNDKAHPTNRMDQPVSLSP